jgi:SAM-dependent methyltransferase
MTRSSKDGSAGDVDYARIGGAYSVYRRPDPRIAAFLQRQLGGARTVLNVGAGSGSYEPSDRLVTAVEPSATMRAHRPPHRPQAIDAVAEELPFPDKSFDASMGVFTIHQWADLAKGLAELRRVTRRRVMLVSCAPNEVQNFWLNSYAPEVLAAEARRYPSCAAISAGLGSEVSMIPVPIPLDCADGFNEAYYGRPEMLLDPNARASCSAWSFPEAHVVASYVDHLERDVRVGAWDAAHGHLRSQPFYQGSLYLFVSDITRR